MPIPRLRATTVGIDDPGDLVGFLGPDDQAWLRRGEGLIGLGVAVREPVPHLAEGERWWHDILDAMSAADRAGLPRDGGRRVAGSGPVAFGSFAFDPANSTRGSTLIVPALVVGRRGGRGWLTAITADGSEPRPALPGRTEPAESPGAVTWRPGPLDGAAWAERVGAGVRRIQAGELDKVVLARSVLAQTEAPLDARWLIARLAADYRSCWTFRVDSLVGATPEMLVRRDDGLATSRVLAGTIRRTGHEVDDLALAASLSRSGKNLAEHEYAVASVARALAPYCSGMNVPDSPYVLELPNVLHLATDVTAAAHPEVTALALAAALHPSAAVCGTPTDTARALIAELEQLDRGRYAGPVGWVDAAGDGEWGIALRSAELLDPHTLQLFAGCGVVADSDPASELAESQAKLIPMRHALGDRRSG